MITMLATALWSTVEGIMLACTACVCAEEVGGTGTCSTRGDYDFEIPIDPSALATLAVIGLLVLAICVCTISVVRRDGYGQRPTRDDYDTRRPEP